MKLRVIDLGLCPYERAYELQLEMQKRVQAGEEDTLLLVEHPKVITLGRNAQSENLLVSEEAMMKMGYEVHRIERGGDVTYHGPGQLVGYVLFNLKKNHPAGIRVFVEKLEEVFVTYLRDKHQIEAQRDPINSGVFIGLEKITAIGLAVKRGVTLHGFAFNVNTNVLDYQVIVPCGLADRGVTTLERLTGTHLDMETVKMEIADTLATVFGYERVEYCPTPLEK